MEVSMTGSRMAKLGNFKDTMKMVCPAHHVLGSDASASAPAPAPALGTAEIAYKEQQDVYAGHDGGYMIPIHSEIGQGMRNHFEKLLNEYRMNDFIPVYLEKGALNFYLNREVKPEEIYSVNEAEQCLEKANQQSGNECGRAGRSSVQRQL